MTSPRGRIAGWLRNLQALTAEPFRERDLGRSAVLFSPHPDDETLACGGLVARKSRAGARLQVVFISDGSRSHAHRMAPGELAVLRRREAVAALRVLGVAEEQIVFLDFPDGRLGDHRPAIARRAEELLGRERPQEVYLPFRAEPPPDHAAASRAVREALRRTGLRPAVYEYPVWFWHHWPFVGLALRPRRRALELVRDSLRFGWGLRLPLGFDRYLDVRDVLPLKWEALGRYRSQMERLAPGPAWAILSDVAGGEFLDGFFQGREVFRRVANA